MVEEQKKKKSREAKTEDTSREILSTKEVSKLLGCTTETVLGYVKAGSLKSARLGAGGRGHHRFLRSDVVSLVAAYVALKGDAK